MIHTVQVSLAGQTVEIETGRVARQAGGAVLVKYGDTVILCTATMSRGARADIDFFPLTCDYEERKYAVGKIPGGFMKRGGKPSEKAILTSRLIDRPIRPLFPNGMRNDVQVICMPLSMDHDHLPDVMAVTGASAALTISNIPFNGPIAAVRVGYIDNEFVINPTFDQLNESALDLVVAATRDDVIMVEAGASEVSEDLILKALTVAQEAIRPLCDAQEELARLVGTVKAEVPIHSVKAEILEALRSRYADTILEAIQDPDKSSREAGISLLKEQIVAEMADTYPDDSADLKEAAEKVVKEQIRRLIMERGVRPDGRKPDEIRQITCEVGILPRVHGSGLFTRGQTQVLTSLVLGAKDDAQIIDTLEEDTEKHYMHFYNFPPYSVGETRQMRGPGRREIGHGALAERALRPVLPSTEDFPYTMLLTSEVLESNGSTSMASTCGSTLALMDAGVKIKAPVAGIAMGLMTEGDKFVVLSDIQGMEDFTGDMDFKVTGTADGVTAMQLDTKIGGVPHEVFVQALEQARIGRLHILDRMIATIESPREQISQYAPMIVCIEINPERIGDLIGPGGRTIKKICADTGARIQVEQDGRVFIAADDGQSGEAARRMVEGLTRSIAVGEEFTGRVTRVASLGAFVELLPGKDGLVPAAQLDEERPRRVDDLVRIGDTIKVRVTEIDSQGRVNLTARGMGNTYRTPSEHSGQEPSSEGPARRHERPRDNDSGDDMPRARFRPRR